MPERLFAFDVDGEVLEVPASQLDLFKKDAEERGIADRVSPVETFDVDGETFDVRPTDVGAFLKANPKASRAFLVDDTSGGAFSVREQDRDAWLNSIDDEEARKKMAEQLYFDSELPRQSSRLGRVAKLVPDAGLAFTKGAVKLPEATAGLVDLATAGPQMAISWLATGKARTGYYGKLQKAGMDAVGLNTDVAAGFYADAMSDDQKAAIKQVDDATGFVDTAMAYIENPSVALMQSVESLPLMLVTRGATGAAMKSGAIASRFAPGMIAAAAEGALSAGSIQEEMRRGSDEGLTTGRQAGMAALAGVGVAAVGAASNKLGARLGIEDIEVPTAKKAMLEQAVKERAKQLPYAVRLAAATLKEGLVEEGGQTFVEATATNIGEGKPIMEGVGKQVVGGIAAGGVMGFAANIKPQANAKADAAIRSTLEDFGADAQDIDALSEGDRKRVQAALIAGLDAEMAHKLIKTNEGITLYDKLAERWGYNFKNAQEGIAPNFNPPMVEGPDGKPVPNWTSFGGDGRSIDDPESGIAITQDGKGEITVWNRKANQSVPAESEQEAVELAKNMSVYNQAVERSREKKLGFLSDAAARLAGKVEFQAFNTFDELMAAHGEEIQGASKNTGGVKLADGTVAVVLDNIGSPYEMLETVLHEAGVHVGIREVFADETARNEFLGKIDKREIAPALAHVKKLGYDPTSVAGIEEALAYMYEKRTVNPTTYQRGVAALHDQLRKLFPKMQLSRSDIEVIMSRAQRQVRGEGGIVENRGGTAPQVAPEAGAAQPGTEQGPQGETLEGPQAAPANVVTPSADGKSQRVTLVPEGVAGQGEPVAAEVVVPDAPVAPAKPVTQAKPVPPKQEAKTAPQVKRERTKAKVVANPMSLTAENVDDYSNPALKRAVKTLKQWRVDERRKLNAAKVKQLDGIIKVTQDAIERKGRRSGAQRDAWQSVVREQTRGSLRDYLDTLGEQGSPILSRLAEGPEFYMPADIGEVLMEDGTYNTKQGEGFDQLQYLNDEQKALLFKPNRPAHSLGGMDAIQEFWGNLDKDASFVYGDRQMDLQSFFDQFQNEYDMFKSWQAEQRDLAKKIRYAETPRQAERVKQYREMVNMGGKKTAEEFLEIDEHNEAAESEWQDVPPDAFDDVFVASAKEAMLQQMDEDFSDLAAFPEEVGDIVTLAGVEFTVVSVQADGTMGFSNEDGSIVVRQSIETGGFEYVNRDQGEARQDVVRAREAVARDAQRDAGEAGKANAGAGAEAEPPDATQPAAPEALTLSSLTAADLAAQKEAEAVRAEEKRIADEKADYIRRRQAEPLGVGDGGKGVLKMNQDMLVPGVTSDTPLFDQSWGKKPAAKKQTATPAAERVAVVGIGDLHGESPDKLDASLERDGVLQDGKWATDKTVVQVGDVTDRGKHTNALIRRMRELQRQSGNKLVRIIGNHDFFHIFGRAERVRGKTDADTTAMLREDVLAGRVVAAWAEGDTLYTHAGLDLSAFPEYEGMPIQDIVADLNRRLVDAVRGGDMESDPLFGNDGIIWTRGKIENPQFRQVVGHTPAKDGKHSYKDGDRVKYIDTGRVFGGDDKLFFNTEVPKTEPRPQPKKPAQRSVLPEGSMRPVAQRIVNAENRFIEFAMDRAGLTKPEAEAVLSEYKRLKAIKIDAVVGQFQFADGDFGNADVMRRALKQAQGTAQADRIPPPQAKHPGFVLVASGVAPSDFEDVHRRYVDRRNMAKGGSEGTTIRRQKVVSGDDSWMKYQNVGAGAVIFDSPNLFVPAEDVDTWKEVSRSAGRSDLFAAVEPATPAAAVGSHQAAPHVAVYNGTEVEVDDFKQAAMRVAGNLQTGEHGYVKTPDGKLYEIVSNQKGATLVKAMRTKAERNIAELEARIPKAKSDSEREVLSKRLAEMKAKGAKPAPDGGARYREAGEGMAVTPEQDTDSLGFYSHLRRVIEQKVPARATVAQIRATLDPAKGSGVKADEMEWSGLGEFLAGKKPGDMVTKDELLAATKDLEIKEVVKGYTQDDLAMQEELSSLARLGRDRTPEQESRYERLASHLRIGKDLYNKTKFEQYQLPGGENYRELLLTLPTSDNQAVDAMSREQLGEWYKNEVGYNPVDDDPAMTTEALRSLVREYDSENGVVRAPSVTTEFRSQHFDEPNILAHVRYNERTDADGNKVLFLEEIQSDWHQAGREKGYNILPKMKWEIFDNGGMGSSVGEDSYAIYPMKDGSGEFALSVNGNTQNVGTIEELKADAEGRQEYVREGVVPNAPFKDTSKGWARLAFKRMLRLAAERGFDRVGWTTGEQQAERYDLSKQVSRVEVHGSSDRTYNVFADDMSGNRAIEKRDVPESELSGVIGKELASKVINSPMRRNEFTGLDLKVGGEGMRIFYDQIVPSIANDIGKKFGARTEDMETFTKNDLGTPMYATVHSIPVTPAMRESVMQGQTRYRMAGESLDEPTRNSFFGMVSALAGTPEDGSLNIADAVRKKTQDFRLPIRRMYEQIMKRPGATFDRETMEYTFNAERRRSLFSVKREEMSGEFVAPILTDLKTGSWAVDDLDRYAQALHAPYYNRMVADRRDGTVAPGAMADDLFAAIEEDGWAGKGLADSRAEQIVANYNRRTNGNLLKRAAEKLVAMNRKVLDQRVADGLMSREQADLWKRLSPYYVPLKVLDAQDGTVGVGGKNLAAKESKRAIGHFGKENASSFINSLVQMDAAINRGLANKERQNLWRFLQANPDASRYVLRDTIPSREKTTGKYADGTLAVTTVPDMMYLQKDGVVPVKFEGVVKYIEFIGPSGAAIGKAVKETTLFGRGFEAAMRPAMHFFKWMRTMGVLDFALRNGQNDAVDAFSNMAAEGYTKEAAMAAKIVPSAWKMLVQHERGKAVTGPYARYYEEYKKSGSQMANKWVDATGKTWVREVELSLGIDSDPKAVKLAKSIIDNIEKLNTVVEIGTRFSVYTALRESGKSVSEAAEYARNITVDFERKGEWTPILNTLWAFSNVAIQGNARFIRAIVKGKHGRRFVGAVLASAFLNATLNMMLSEPDDDDDEDEYMKIRDHIKRQRILIHMPGTKKYATIRARGLPGWLWWQGTALAEATFGRRSWGSFASQMPVTLFGTLNPIGQGEGLTLTATPSLMAPFVQQDINKKWTGQELVPGRDDEWNKYVPRSTLAYESTPQMYKATAKYLNAMAGGDDVTGSKADVSPEIIKHWVDFLVGSFPALATRSLDTTLRLARGEDIPVNSVPVLRDFMVDAEDFKRNTRYYEAIDEFKRSMFRLKGYEKYEERQRLYKEKPYLRSRETIKAKINEIRKLEDEAAKLQLKGIDTPLAEKEIEKKQRALSDIVLGKR